MLDVNTLLFLFKCHSTSVVIIPLAQVRDGVECMIYWTFENVCPA